MIRIGLDLDEQIAAAELRIKGRKQRLLAEARSLHTAARYQLTSPSALLLAAGIGFVIGRVTEGARAPGQSRLRRIWDSLSESVKAATSVMRAPGLMWLAGLFGRAASGSVPGEDVVDRSIATSSLNVPVV